MGSGVREGIGRRMMTTSEVIDNLRDFMSYAQGLEGDEKALVMALSRRKVWTNNRTTLSGEVYVKKTSRVRSSRLYSKKRPTFSHRKVKAKKHPVVSSREAWEKYRTTT